MSDKYLLAIYTCAKYQQKAEFLYRALLGRLPSNVDIKLFFGNCNIQTQCPHIILNCEDDYDNLIFKTTALLNYTYKNGYAGLLKCDDDIFPNLQVLNRFFAIPNKGDYIGNIVTQKQDFISISHIGKSTKFDKPINAPKCTYCAGPLYYLSRNAMEKIISKDFIGYFSEDIAIGLNAADKGITPTEYNFYSSDIFALDKCCIENANSESKYLFTYLQGGLGNQLFQLAAAYGTGLLRGMLPVAVLSNNPAIYVHNENGVDTYINTVFRNFVCMKGIQFGKINVWSENDANVKNSFMHCKSIQMRFDAENDMLMHGYFQTEKYFLHCKADLLDKIIDAGFLGKIQTAYPRAATSYFIHVRRGDYVEHPIYAIDYNTYLTNALAYIESKDPGKKHYYVLSNDPAYCKTYALLANRGNTEFTVLDTLSTMDTLYLMMACAKGAICANSSFSWWGSYMNRCPDKIVCFPDVWVTKIPETTKLDVYYEGSIVIPTKTVTNYC
jgi:hypothetical protein